MSTARQSPRSLAKLIEQLAIDRKTAARRKGGRIRGLQRELMKAQKRMLILRTETQLIKEGAPERGLNKKIAQRTKLPYEYVMKYRRTYSSDADKEK
jgi:hypothetical protein